MNTNWDNLRYFNALAQHGTLSEAARQIGVSHSTVQRHITSFESELNVRLFQVSASGYTLTSAGETLYQETLAIQQSLNSVSSRLETSEGAIQGAVSITVPDTIGHFLLPDILGKLQDRYPKISYNVSIINQISKIEEFEADIAIRTGQQAPADLIGRCAGEVRFAVCTTHSYLNKHALTSENCLNKGQHFIQLDNNFAAATFYAWQPAKEDRASGIYTNGFLNAYRYCRAGLGIALLPAYILDFDSDLVALPCNDLPTPNQLWVLSHADLRDTNRVKAVRQILAEELSLVFDAEQQPLTVS